MSREWTPGDLALVSSWRGADLPAFRVRRDGYGTVWCVLQDGDTRGLSDTEVGDNARPLVVIDPEDREAVERFREIAARWNARVPYADMAEPGDMDETDAMQIALREFANPKPPKPPEPTGLGAVVEDAEGDQWVVASQSGLFRKATGKEGCGAFRRYADIDAVRVLSEGVQS